MRFLGLVGLLTVILFSFKFALNTFQSEPASIAENSESETRKTLQYPKKSQSPKPNTRRSPASTNPRKINEARGPLEIEKDFDKFQDFAGSTDAVEDEKLISSGSTVTESENMTSQDDFSEGRKRKRRDSVPAAELKKEDSALENDTFSIANYSPTPTLPTPAPSVDKTPPSGSGTSAPNLTPLTCQASVGGGTFNSPINVSLGCSTSSTVSYCLSEGSCCDPASGSVYTLPLNIGATESTFCLSFMGRDASGKQSTIVQQTYTFNAAAPNLQVHHGKIVYQTTELEGSLSLSSDDFGSHSVSGGVLNFKENDPVVSGYPTCADQVETATPLSPIAVMPETPLSHLNPALQLDVFFGNLELVYGDNFITSFLLNSAYGNQYSCSTTKIVLEDFPYFDPIPMVATGAGGVHEFSGGFTSMGVFQAPAPSLSRAPAGASVENKGGQELRSGLFGIFY